jgi:hypothetical protein
MRSSLRNSKQVQWPRSKVERQEERFRVGDRRALRLRKVKYEEILCMGKWIAVIPDWTGRVRDRREERILCRSALLGLLGPKGLS